MLLRLNAIPPFRWIQIACFASALVTWPLAAEFELFEKFYYYSRDHEDWDLDEFFLLVLNLSVALLASFFVQARHLGRVILERESERNRADSNALQDPLTGLPNRRAFMAKLGELGQSRSTDRLIAVIDLDQFKQINDLYGHPAGDHVLCKAGDRLRETFARCGTVARIGGDEFAILFDANADIGTVEKLTRRWLAMVGDPVPYFGRSLQVGGSVGLAVLRADDCTETGLKNADRALYAVKAAGRGQFNWYDAALDNAASKRCLLETQLRQAIKDGTVEPYFQPIFELKTGVLQGFEVLARWSHPEHGFVPPDTFIPIAEDGGLIGDLGWAIMRNACKAARGWDAKLMLSINISPQQFLDRTLPRKIETILTKTEFPPDRLELEVTERAVIRDFQTARETLQQLRAMGISTALDDFGTGYSSLASLRELPFDRIKIDRSFVTGIATAPENQKIVAGIMALAEGLELQVTAEGIETENDRHFMSDLDCALGQGFWFDKAVPAEDIPWLQVTRWSELRNGLSGADGAPEAKRAS